MFISQHTESHKKGLCLRRALTYPPCRAVPSVASSPSAGQDVGGPLASDLVHLASGSGKGQGILYQGFVETEDMLPGIWLRGP